MHTFSKTSAYSPMQVMGMLMPRMHRGSQSLTTDAETLSLVELWFKELMDNDMTLPPSFDCRFFCRGAQILCSVRDFRV